MYKAQGTLPLAEARLTGLPKQAVATPLADDQALKQVAAITV
jgi:hypothetical protein